MAAAAAAAAGSSQGPPPRRALPGLYAPDGGTLVDVVMQKIVVDWAFQKYYNRFYLAVLTDHLRMGLISYLSSRRDQAVSLADLQVLLLPPPPRRERRGGWRGLGAKEAGTPCLTGAGGQTPAR